MVEKELLNLILQDFPESLILTFVCFSLLNLKLDWKKILIIALLQTFTNLVRLLPLAFGMHTIILIFALALYIRIATNLRLSKISIAVIACFAVIIISEGIYSQPMLNFLNLTYQEAVSSPYLRAIFSIPYFIALLLLPVGKKIYLHYRHKNLSSSR